MRPGRGNWALAAVAALYAVSIPFTLPAEPVLLAAAGLLGLGVMLLRARLFYRIAALVVLAAGAALVLGTPARLSVAWLGFGQLLDVAVLLFVIPVLAVPFRLRDYGADVAALAAARLRTQARRYAMLSGSSASLAAMISVGAIPLTHASLRFPRPEPRLESRALTRGVVLGVMWSPMGGFFSTVLSRLDAAVVPMMAACLLVAAVVWLVDAAVTGRRVRREAPPGPQPPPPPGPVPRSARFGAATLAVAISAYSLLLVAVHEATGVSVIDAIILAAVPYVLLWAVLLGHARRAVPRVRAALRDGASGACAQASVLVAMGLLSAAFVDAGFGASLAAWLAGVGLPGYVLMAGLSLLPLLLSQVGLHPFILVVMMLGVIDAGALGVPASAFGLALMGGAAGSLASSPFSIAVNIAGGLTRLPPWSVAWANRWFGLFVWALACAAAIGLALLLG